jgi:hypothetical protein
MAGGFPKKRGAGDQIGGRRDRHGGVRPLAASGDG